MKLNLMATGAYYACGQDKTRCREFLEHLENDKPEMMLVLMNDPVYDVVISVEEDSQRCATISRGDIGLALSAMMKDGEQSLTAQVVSVNYEGRYFTLEMEVEGEIEEIRTDKVDWSLWPLVEGIPMLVPTQEEVKVSAAIRILNPVMKGKRRMKQTTTLAYLRSLVENCRCDVSRETQTAINAYRRVLAMHEDKVLRAYEPEIVHAQNSLGSRKRIGEMNDRWGDFLEGEEAMDQLRQWMMLQGECIAEEEMLERVDKALETIDNNLRLLPENLYCDINDYGQLMHRLLYLNIPQARLKQLTSMLSLREKLLEMREQLMPLDCFAADGFATGEDNPAEVEDDAKRTDGDKGLFGSVAMEFWNALQEEGFVDGNLQRTEKMNRQTTMYVAMCFAEKLHLRNRWKEFQSFWNIKNLAQERSKMTESGRLPMYHDTIDEIFGN